MFTRVKALIQSLMTAHSVPCLREIMSCHSRSSPSHRPVIWFP